MKINVDVKNIKISFSDKRAIKKALLAGIKMYSQGTNCVVYVTLCNDEYIREINREHREKDTVTDVLSFPLVMWEKPMDWENLKTGEDINPIDSSVELGDIIISMDAVKRQALEYGHSEKRELCYLTVHGLMHLMGFDHMTEEDKILMRNAEESVMAEINQVR